MMSRELPALKRRSQRGGSGRRTLGCSGRSWALPGESRSIPSPAVSQGWAEPCRAALSPSPPCRAARAFWLTWLRVPLITGLSSVFWCELCAQNTICFANGIWPFRCRGTFQKSLPRTRLFRFFFSSLLRQFVRRDFLTISLNHVGEHVNPSRAFSPAQLSLGFVPAALVRGSA